MSVLRIKSFKNFGKDTEEMRRRRNEMKVVLRKTKKHEDLSRRRKIEIKNNCKDEVDSCQSSNKSIIPSIVLDSSLFVETDAISQNEWMRKIASLIKSGNISEATTGVSLLSSLLTSSDFSIFSPTNSPNNSSIFSPNSTNYTTNSQNSTTHFSTTTTNSPTFTPTSAINYTIHSPTYTTNSTIHSPTYTTNSPTSTIHSTTNSDPDSSLNSLLNSILSSSLLPPLISFLSSSSSSLQLHSATILNLISSGTSAQTAQVVQWGAAEPLVSILEDWVERGRGSEELVEEVLWTLGNILGDSAVNYRDLLVEKGLMSPLASLVATHVQTGHRILHQLTWIFSNLFRTKTPVPSLSLIRECLPSLSLLINYPHKDVICDACWALYYLSNCNESSTNEIINELTNGCVIQKLIELISSEQTSIIFPALKTLGNIVATSAQIDLVIENGGLVILAQLLENPKGEIVRETGWILSSIANGTKEQISHLFSHNIIPLLINLLANGNYDGKNEAAWTLTNITCSGEPSFILHLCEKGIISPLSSIFSSSDMMLLIVALNALQNILKVFSELGQVEIIRLAIEECGGLDKIEQLITHENPTIYEKASLILDKYLTVDTGSDEENGSFEIQALNGEFQFNVDNQKYIDFEW